MRRRTVGRWVVAALAVGAAAVGAGCAAQQKQRTLESVAKDWCLTIRASQVIPVYPLTEDLQPGDVYLVTITADEQAAIYRERGFLPFDRHVARLEPIDFAGFYDRGHGTDRPPLPPNRWKEALADSDQMHGWSAAPRAFFPTYSFEVSSGGGLSVALPVKGVPVGLSLMGSSAASGTVAITDAYVYGVDLGRLLPLIDEWASQPDHALLLAQMREAAGHDIYLRVVSRVYLAGGVLVSLVDRSGASGGADVAQAPPVTVPGASPGPDSASAVELYEEMLGLLDRKLTAPLPGGAVRFAQVSARSVVAAERFERPLVIGYLGFDFPVLPGGVLGTPVMTQRTVEGQREPTTALGVFSSAQERSVQLRGWIDRLDEPQREAVYVDAAERLGAAMMDTFERERAKRGDVGRAFSASLAAFELESASPAVAQERAAAALEGAWRGHERASGGGR